MPMFQFEAMDATGQEIRDVVEAPSQDEAQDVDILDQTVQAIPAPSQTEPALAHAPAVAVRSEGELEPR